MFENTRICKQCIMPENKPEVFLNDEGICNICLAHNYVKKNETIHKPLESDLIKILDKHRGKKKYDCMVMCSGGKDSTSALYYMKKRYNLNILAFMFDHGFESEDAISNVNKAVEILGIDLIFYKSSFMKPMFEKMITSKTKAVICHTCSIWYMELAFDVAARYDIPIIIAGWTKGQSTKQEIMSKCGCNVHDAEFKSMANSTREFLLNELGDLPQYKNFPKSMEEVLNRAKKRHKSLVLSPHWFLPYGPDEYIKTIKDELDWKVPKLSYPSGSTNCLLNFISVYNSMKYFGYTHYHVEASKLIRDGVITREEALEQLKINFDEDILQTVADKLNVNFKNYL